MFSDTDSELTAIEAKLTKACQIKRGLMQNLLIQLPPCQRLGRQRLRQGPRSRMQPPALHSHPLAGLAARHLARLDRANPTTQPCRAALNCSSKRRGLTQGVSWHYPVLLQPLAHTCNDARRSGQTAGHFPRFSGSPVVVFSMSPGRFSPVAVRSERHGRATWKALVRGCIQPSKAVRAN